MKKAVEKPVETPKATPKKGPGRPPKTATPASTSRASGRAKKAVTSYAERDDGDEFDDDELDNADDIFGDEFKGKGKGKDDYVEDAGSDDEDLPIKIPHRGTSAKPAKKIKDEDDFELDDDVDMKDLDAEDDLMELEPEEQAVKSEPKKTTAGRKRKSPEPEPDEEEDSEDEKPKKKAPKKAAPAKSPAKKKAKKEDTAEDADIQAIYDSIPTVRAPTPPPQDKKFDWRANAGRSEPAPTGGGGGDMPSGSETCLAGLNFVFTGVLQKWGRTEAQELVKRHGGKVTGAPSKKTSYVVLGSDAGPSKLRKIQEMDIKTIDEDGLSLLIEKLTQAGNKGDSKAQAAFREKQKKEEEKIKQQAAELEQQEKKRLKELEAVQKAKAAAGITTAVDAAAQSADPEVDARLWTTKYAPNTLNQICGNKAVVERLQRWLQKYPKNLKTGLNWLVRTAVASSVRS